MEVTKLYTLLLTVLLVCNSCGRTESPDQVKISLYRQYLSSKSYDSSKIEIPQLQVKADLIDSSEFISFSQRKFWKYVSIDEFKTMNLQSAYKYKDKYELNLMSVLASQDSRDEYLARYTVVYIKKGNSWILNKHKMHELERMDQIMQSLKADSTRMDSIKNSKK